MCDFPSFGFQTNQDRAAQSLKMSLIDIKRLFPLLKSDYRYLNEGKEIKIVSKKG